MCVIEMFFCGKTPWLFILQDTLPNKKPEFTF